jgi:hypothetical protein
MDHPVSSLLVSTFVQWLTLQSSTEFRGDQRDQIRQGSIEFVLGGSKKLISSQHVLS